MKKKQFKWIITLVVVVLIMVVWNIQKKEEPKTLRVNQEHTCMMQMYALDDKGTLIPLSLPCDEKDHIKDKMKKIVDNMSKLSTNGFIPLFVKGTQLEDAVLVNGVLTLCFNEKFSNYEKQYELRVLEAIAWIATQFEGVKEVKIKVNDQILTQMPNGTPIPSTLDKRIGINNFLTTTTALHNSDPLTVFYTKEIHGKMYYVPKTKRVASNQTLDETIATILEDVSVNSGLKQPLAQEKIKITEATVLKDNVLQVHLNHQILEEDRSAKKQAYETLILSLSMIDQTKKIQVFVEDVAVTLHGMNEVACSADELIYNEIK